MNYIVVDVERNSFNYETDKPSEIIEIGAVKLNQNGNVIDIFSALVKPSCPLSAFTKKLTHITEDMVSSAPSFEKVYQDFIDFMGEQYVFVSWGKEDYRFFQADCTRQGLPLFSPNMFLDIQEVYMYGVLKTFSTPSLASAVEFLGIEESGVSHRAFSDAENTAKIFVNLTGLFDVHSVKKPLRYAKKLYFVNGELNSSGKKKYTKIIKMVIKKTGNSHVTWKDFKTHAKWLEYKEDFQIDNLLEKYYEKYFDKYKGIAVHSTMQKHKVKSV
ncbi:exonuclease domain-containing protein [Peribacillus sp. SCS-155]|uniref:exonuclease domain-containing protein n=1 Tax=Peribacillus sedimenti TaxID=3115297 RepID=UPI003905A15A